MHLHWMALPTLNDDNIKSDIFNFIFLPTFITEMRKNENTSLHSRRQVLVLLLATVMCPDIKMQLCIFVLTRKQ
jgi:hypothetical protein